MALNEAESIANVFWYMWFNPTVANCQWNFNIC
jgi:hypothetical protein